jgi:hypothetical protein
MADEPDYTPTLAPEFAHMHVDVNHPRYVEAAAAARQAGLTQAQFSALLNLEAKNIARQTARPPQAAAAAQPAPVAPAKIPGYDKMTFAQRLLAGEARKAGR